MSRTKIIIGNWKMHKNRKETSTFFAEFIKLIKGKTINCDYGIAPSFTSLIELNIQKKSRLKKLIIAAQNCYYQYEGAFTGEISIKMLQEFEVTHVIIGHSERKLYFNETDETISAKVSILLEQKMIPIICCGETLEEYEKGKTDHAIKQQITLALAKVKHSFDIAKVIIAYEPIWAIGTGKTATAEQAQKICAMIRKFISEKYGEKLGQQVRIQYGGSVKPDNIATLLEKPDIDGALVGGAALKAADFYALLTATSKLLI